MNFIVIFKLHIINVKGNCRRDLECVIKSTYNSDKDIDIDERGKKAVLTLSGNCYMTWLTHMFNLITHKTLIRSARLIINTQFTKYLACNLKKQYRVISYL
jgi:hypothetical protein